MPRYRDIEYHLRQSKRKTMSIYIEPDGSVSVLAPESLSMEEIEKVIEGKRYWIYSKLTEWQELNRSRIEREFVSGQGFPYLGRSYQLKIVDDQDVPLKLYQGYFCLRKSNLPRAEEAFINFYREKGVKKIPGRVEHYREMMGVKPREIRVMDLKTRWASCSESGALNFHWKCMMAPLTVIDYIVVHELSHLYYPHHTHEFWNLVDKILPDYLERKKWLRENGAGLEL